MEYFDAMNMVNQMAQQNNEWSAQMAANQWNWEAQMANTAHQREVADLKAAGLNPILSAHTNGATTPNVSVPQADNSNISGVTNLLQDYMSLENAKSLLSAAAGGAGHGSGGFSGKNGYYTKNPWLMILEDFIEGAADMPADKAIRLAGQKAGEWFKDNYDGNIFTTIWYGLTGNGNTGKEIVGRDKLGLGAYDAHGPNTGQTWVDKRNGKVYTYPANAWCTQVG